MNRLPSPALLLEETFRPIVPKTPSALDGGFRRESASGRRRRWRRWRTSWQRSGRSSAACAICVRRKLRVTTAPGLATLPPVDARALLTVTGAAWSMSWAVCPACPWSCSNLHGRESRGHAELWGARGRSGGHDGGRGDVRGAGGRKASRPSMLVLSRLRRVPPEEFVLQSAGQQRAEQWSRNAE